MKIEARASALLLLAAVPAAQAQSDVVAYPSRPIRIIVPLAAGGAIDTIARVMSPQLSARLGQSVIVDNRAGAAETIGTELTARATPDGHTVLMASASFVVSPQLFPVRYDVLKDFTYLTQVTRQPYVLIVHPSVPAASARELIAWIKVNPGRVNFASAGTGSLMHLTGELFKASTGVSMTHVPYKGMALAYPDILAGRVQLGFPAIITALPHVRTGKIRALGVTSRVPVESLPGVPTLHESGVAGFEVQQWYGVYAPAGVPAAIAARLNQEFAAVTKGPEIVALLAASGSEAVGNALAEFAAHVRSEFDRWRKIIRDANVSVK
ncbi:MAG: tripartite tricarboxylate transporter substrate binding protein [Betaproteobacteria bacterium]|nr:tripartite tricarboxylate transporter substrate binding protein [Betaproteobacteria bacterium]